MLIRKRSGYDVANVIARVVLISVLKFIRNEVVFNLSTSNFSLSLIMIVVERISVNALSKEFRRVHFADCEDGNLLMLGIY